MIKYHNLILYNLRAVSKTKDGLLYSIEFTKGYRQKYRQYYTDNSKIERKADIFDKQSIRKRDKRHADRKMGRTRKRQTDKWPDGQKRL